MLHPVITSAFELNPLRRIGIPERVFRILFPFALGISYLILLLLAMPYGQWLIIGGLMLAYILPMVPTGKESVIPIGIALGFPWWLMAFTIALLDVLGGIFMALNFDIALKIPGFGRWLQKFIANGEQFFERRPWLERFSFMGVVLFVMVPLQGSGRATLVGRMMGLSPIGVLLAITIGAFIGCTIIALSAEAIKNLIVMYPLLGISVAIVVVIVLVALYIWYQLRMGQSEKR
ncbi:MAG: small multi-drug export protein [Methanoregulaceae archaeon]|nr:small multi-drug export protein [Methanoregulaceae archaeon]